MTRLAIIAMTLLVSAGLSIVSIGDAVQAQRQPDAMPSPAPGMQQPLASPSPAPGQQPAVAGLVDAALANFILLSQAANEPQVADRLLTDVAQGRRRIQPVFLADNEARRLLGASNGLRRFAALSQEVAGNNRQLQNILQQNNIARGRVVGLDLVGEPLSIYVLGAERAARPAASPSPPPAGVQQVTPTPTTGVGRQMTPTPTPTTGGGGRLPGLRPGTQATPTPTTGAGQQQVTPTPTTGAGQQQVTPTPTTGDGGLLPGLVPGGQATPTPTTGGGQQGSPTPRPRA